MIKDNQEIENQSNYLGKNRYETHPHIHTYTLKKTFYLSGKNKYWRKKPYMQIFQINAVIKKRTMNTNTCIWWDKRNTDLHHPLVYSKTWTNREIHMSETSNKNSFTYLFVLWIGVIIVRHAIQRHMRSCKWCRLEKGKRKTNYFNVVQVKLQ